MTVDAGKIQEIAKDTGFLPDTVEKIIRLSRILSEIEAHPFLSGKFVLKGGTAIHLFHLEGKRLSVDLDLNYVGSIGRKEMTTERPRLEEDLKRLCVSLGYAIRRIPTEHAGGKWQMGYQGSSGRPQVLELDINYLYRVSIWGTEKRGLTFPGFSDLQCRFPIVHPLELWAGKIVATIVRAEPRDLFDLLFVPKKLLKSDDLRKTITLIGSASRNDWRKMDLVSLEESDPRRLQERLFPVIRSGEKVRWSGLAKKAIRILKPFLQFRKDEKLYLDLIEEKGVYRPEILFSEPWMIEKLSRHPVLLWKAENRSHFQGMAGNLIK